jgi:hypothetical protein
MKYLNRFDTFNESYHRQYDSSITEKDAQELINHIYQYKDQVHNRPDLIKKCEDRLYIYDKENVEFVIDSLFHSNVDEEDIIRMGDTIMDKYGTEPQMVEHAFEDCFSIFVSNGIHSSDDAFED